ncbi:MAG: hypothetical protein M0Q12_14375 [Synergistaceae bacterium]|nr:hypothetical protein [Synergistaceae bacterium]
MTVITIDNIDQSNWFIGGKPVDMSRLDKVCYIEIRLSKGTSTREQMANVSKVGKDSTIV